MRTDAPSVSGRNEPTSVQSSYFDDELHTYLANLNEQAQDRYRLIIKQMTVAEGVTENLKRQSQWAWIRAIINCADEIVRRELINA